MDTARALEPVQNGWELMVAKRGAAVPAFGVPRARTPQIAGLVPMTVGRWRLTAERAREAAVVVRATAAGPERPHPNESKSIDLTIREPLVGKTPNRGVATAPPLLLFERDPNAIHECVERW